MTRERCSSCGRPLLWASGRLVCANVHCTDGHNLAVPSNTARRKPAAASPLPAAGTRAAVRLSLPGSDRSQGES